MLNKVVSVIGKFALSNTMFNLFLRAFSPKMTEWLWSEVLPSVKNGIMWLADKLSSVLPSTWVPKVNVWVKHAVRKVEETWPNEEKVRFILRLVYEGKLPSTVDARTWTEEKVKELAAKGWEQLKLELPSEVLEILDAARKALAITFVKEKAAEEGYVGKLSASVISAKIDRAVTHEREKATAKSVETLINESRQRQESLKAA